MTRAEKREVKTAAADIIDMRDYLDDVYEFIRGVGECAGDCTNKCGGCYGNCVDGSSCSAEAGGTLI